MVNECKAPFEKRGAFFDTPCGRWEPAFSKNLPTPQAGVGDHEVVEGGRLRPLSAFSLGGRPLNNVGRQYK